MSMANIGIGVGTMFLGDALGAGGGGGGQSMPVSMPFSSNNGLFNTSLNEEGGISSNAVGQMADVQGMNLDQAGLFGGMATNNAGADLSNQLGMDFLSNMGSYDPNQIAKMQFDIMNPILQDQFNQNNLALENRQFMKGQTNSTVGGNEFGQQFDSQEDARRKLLFDSFGMGLAGQQQQATLGNQFLMQDPKLRGLFQSLSGNALTNVNNIDQQGLNRFGTFATARGASPTGPGAMTPGQTIGAGLLNSGVNSVSQGVNSLFQPNYSATPGMSGGHYMGPGLNF